MARILCYEHIQINSACFEQMKPSATVCRPIRGDCDLGEYCDGVSEFCPSDAYRLDGTSCNAGSVCTILCSCYGYTSCV
jgi:disintegrin and metalloproteinase domain-containing protein 15